MTVQSYMHFPGGPLSCGRTSELQPSKQGREACAGAAQCTAHSQVHAQLSDRWVEATEACMTDQVCVPQADSSPFMLRRCCAKSHGKVP